MSGFSTDVTYTVWKGDQPNDPIPTCISTDNKDNFPQWRDWNCAESVQFICQGKKMVYYLITYWKTVCNWVKENTCETYVDLGLLMNDKPT